MEKREILFKKLKTKMKNQDLDFEEALIRFLIGNHWFDIKTDYTSDGVYIDEIAFFSHEMEYNRFFENRHKTIEEKCDLLLMMLSVKLPNTAKKVEAFFKQFEIGHENQYYLYDFFCAFVKKETILCTDDDLEKIIEIAYEELNKYNGDVLNYYFKWVRKHHKVKYLKDYYFGKRYTKKNDAYDEEDYLHLVYYLFCTEYIDDNDMLRKAATSKNYADTWLFLAMHFVSALRTTDMVRIKHPKLTMTPEEVLRRVSEGTFSDEDAILTIESVVSRLKNIPLRPNKNKHKGTNIPFLKMEIPRSALSLIGTLFAVAEAHFLLSGQNPDKPLIRVIRSFEQINRYMGEEIGILFLESDFKTQSANKSYLQSIFLLADDIIPAEENDNLRINGYMLAALARSHKGDYNSFAKSTQYYLKDAKLSGLTPQFVARELFERGNLSFVASMLLRVVLGEEYNNLTVKQQTKMTKVLELSPYQIECTVAIAEKYQNRAISTVEKLFLTEEPIKKQEILTVLHRIGNGNAPSKSNECDCLLSAIQKICPYSDNHNCPACEYSLANLSTVFLMASELKRVLKINETTQNDFERRKSKAILQDIIIPTVNELYMCAYEMYGEETAHLIDKILEEA